MRFLVRELHKLNILYRVMMGGIPLIIPNDSMAALKKQEEEDEEKKKQMEDEKYR